MSDQRPADSRRQHSSGDLGKPEDAVVAEPVAPPVDEPDSAELPGDEVPGIIVGSEDPAAEESQDHWWESSDTEPDSDPDPAPGDRP